MSEILPDPVVSSGSSAGAAFPSTGRFDGAVLHVCVTCRQGRTLVDGDPPPGLLLHEAVRALDPGAPVRAERCLAACERGCTASVAAPGKWRVLLGGLERAHAADLLDYLATYARSATGTVLPSQRAASLRTAVIGRVPA